MDVETFAWWEEEAARRGREGFLRAHGAPFLLVYDPLGDLDVLETGKLPSLKPVRRTPQRPPSGSPVFPVVKQPKVGNVFPDMITVGRARNNDVVLPSSEVSNFHAYFKGEDGRWYVIDADSANGTYRGNERLTGPRELGASDPVAFSRVRCRFVLPAAFFAILAGEVDH